MIRTIAPRVAFCGASGTGKSTLAKAVAEALEVPMCNVGSREVSKAMGFDSPYDVDLAGKRGEFQLALLAHKRSWEYQHTSFVTDRTYADNLAYTRIHSPETVSMQMVVDAAEASARYTHVFFCPLAAFIDTDNDPQRVHNPDYHVRFERELLAMLVETLAEDTRVVVLHQRDVSSRLRAISRAMGR